MIGDLALRLSYFSSSFVTSTTPSFSRAVFLNLLSREETKDIPRIVKILAVDLLLSAIIRLQKDADIADCLHLYLKTVSKVMQTTRKGNSENDFSKK